MTDGIEVLSMFIQTFFLRLQQHQKDENMIGLTLPLSCITVR